jgi:hypothetical protein
LMNEIHAIIPYSGERATFVDNLHQVMEIVGDLLRQIGEGSYLEEVECAVCKSYGR